MWEARAVRFPEHTPNTREYFLLRSIFEEHFPSPSALATVPKVPTLSIYTEACKASSMFPATAAQMKDPPTIGMHTLAHSGPPLPWANCTHILNVASVLYQGLSIACSTPEALAWDPEWADTHEISGRAMRAVHAAGSTFKYQKRQPSTSSEAGPAGSAGAPSAAAAERPIANGKITPQIAPLPACARLDVPKGVAQAAKANGIHVAAG